MLEKRPKLKKFLKYTFSFLKWGLVVFGFIVVNFTIYDKITQVSEDVKAIRKKNSTTTEDKKVKNNKQSSDYSDYKVRACDIESKHDFVEIGHFKYEFSGIEYFISAKRLKRKIDCGILVQLNIPDYNYDYDLNHTNNLPYFFSYTEGGYNIVGVHSKDISIGIATFGLIDFAVYKGGDRYIDSYSVRINDGHGHVPVDTASVKKIIKRTLEYDGLL